MYEFSHIDPETVMAANVDHSPASVTTIRSAIVETAEHLEAVCDHPTTQARMNTIAASPQPERAVMESWILQQVLQNRHGITTSMLKEACHVS